jgi:hypothetical protein
MNIKDIRCNKWYWVIYHPKSKRDKYMGPALCNVRPSFYGELKESPGLFTLPSGERSGFNSKHLQYEIDRDWVVNYYPSYDFLIEYWWKQNSYPTIP